VHHSKPCETCLREYNSIILASFNLLYPSVNVSSDRVCSQRGADPSQLSRSQQTAGANSLSVTEFLQQLSALANQNISGCASFRDASYGQLCAQACRHILHAVYSKVDLAFEDCLVYLFFEDSLLAEREEGSRPVHVACGCDYLSLDLHRRVGSSDLLHHHI